MPRAGRRVLAALGLGLAACGGSGAEAGARTLSVFAAASLAAPFEDLAAQFERWHEDTRVELHFAGTPRLVFQIAEGAPADVFASADPENMRRVAAAGRVAGEPRVFARNRLTLVTSKGNPLGVTALSDLAREDLTVILCGPAVPAGRYARQALAQAGVVARPVSEEPSVMAVVNKVALGEADVGVVYVTDAASPRDEVFAVPIPDQQNVVASYPIAVLRTEARPAAEAFVGFVLSDAGQAILRAHGFEAP